MGYMPWSMSRKHWVFLAGIFLRVHWITLRDFSKWNSFVSIFFCHNYAMWIFSQSSVKSWNELEIKSLICFFLNFAWIIKDALISLSRSIYKTLLWCQQQLPSSFWDFILAASLLTIYLLLFFFLCINNANLRWICGDRS